MASAEVLYKVRLAVAKRKVRLQDNFQDFDKLHHGDVTQEQAKRVLTLCGILPYIQDAEFAELLARYPGHASATFHYAGFLHDVTREEVPANADIIAQAKSKMATQIEDEQMAKAMKLFVHQAVAKSLDVSVPFKDFDRHNIGKVTEAQFERAFPFAAEPVTLARIIRKYRDGNGNVNYKGWVEEVRAAVATATSPPALSQTGRAVSHSTAPKAGVNSADEVLAELRGQFQRHRIRPDDCLRDFDRTHTGSITEGQFRAALGAVKLVHFALTDAQLEALVVRYAIADAQAVGAERRVDYRQFLADTADPTAAVSPRNTRNRLTEAEHELVEKILNKVRNAVHTRRMNLKPTFHDFDRATKGIYQSRTCTRTRFQRALAINKVSLTTAEISMLEKMYSVSLPGEADSDAIDYVSFCEQVDMDDSVKPVTTRSGAVASTGGEGGSASVEASPTRTRAAAQSVEAIIELVAEQVALRKMRLKEFFQDFDPLRSGIMPEEKFATALGMSSIRLSSDELGRLLAHYAHPSLAHHVTYTSFLAAVDTRANNMELKGTVYSQPAPKSGEDEQRLHDIYQRIAKTVRGRGILLPPFFKDYDRHHCGRITAAQFAQTISRHQFPVSTDEVELLCHHYCCPDDPVMVQYRPFLGAIDETEDILSQHALRVAARPTAQPAPPPRATSPEENAANVQSVRGKIRQALLRGVRLNEFFRDADGLRKGYIPTGKFLSAVDMCGVHVTDTEAAALLAEYNNAAVPATTLYQRFMADVGAVSEEAAGTSPAPGLGTLGGAKESDTLTRILERIRQHRITTRRASTVEAFHDFDKLRKGRVTIEQFHAVMTTLGVRLSAAEVTLLNDALSIGKGEVNYVDFSRYVDR